MILFSNADCVAQFLTVTDITVAETKRTKEKIILRELNFKPGDRIQQSQLAAVLEQNEFYLLATGLFLTVELNVKEWDIDARNISVDIVVTESPAIIPIPIFELADRNFNVWWNEFNASFKRVNYGVKLAVLNAWGYGERIKLGVQFGYTPKVDFSALLPFIDNNQSVRLELSGLFSLNKEVAMYNENNKQIFVKREPDVVFKRQQYRVGMVFRPKIRATHIFRVGYNINRVDSALTADSNPDFFLNAKTKQQFVFAEYNFTYDRRDLPVLPTKGWLIGGSFKKDGFGVFDDVSSTYLELSFQYYYPIFERLIASAQFNTRLGLQREKQPYYNYSGLGFGDNYLRGYELFVVEGLDYYYSKFSLGYKVYDKPINWPNIWPIKKLSDMPFQIYISANYDIGYANDPFYFENNSFTNRWLNGGGLGLNILIYNTLQFQVEYSVNHLGQKGVFLHSNSAF